MTSFSGILPIDVKYKSGAFKSFRKYEVDTVRNKFERHVTLGKVCLRKLKPGKGLSDN